MKIVGLSDVKNSWQNMIASLGIGELVRFEPFLSETDLQNLYRKARAVFVPSLMEGFGIPLLEGMASGTPVISSNTTSLPEVGGDAPRYFDPTDIAEMTGALIGVLSDPELQRDMIRKGTFQAEQFHPRLMLQRVRRFWDQLAETDANAL
jgi:glycosyltransferase involved in cell wall biosynthesis